MRIVERRGFLLLGDREKWKTKKGELSVTFTFPLNQKVGKIISKDTSLYFSSSGRWHWLNDCTEGFRDEPEALFPWNRSSMATEVVGPCTHAGHWEDAPGFRQPQLQQPHRICLFGVLACFMGFLLTQIMGSFCFQILSKYLCVELSFLKDFCFNGFALVWVTQKQTLTPGFVYQHFLRGTFSKMETRKQRERRKEGGVECVVREWGLPWRPSETAPPPRKRDSDGNLSFLPV